MSLADVFERVKSGIFHIVFLDANNNRVGSGTAFSTCGYLVTNHHVFSGPQTARVWIRRETDKQHGQGLLLSYADFRQRLRSGSDRNNFDFAVLEFPELMAKPAPHQFVLDKARGHRIGDRVAFLGFPFEHLNLTCHSGIISSYYESGPAKVIQLDASVNPSNSGGPLIDQNTGEVLGIITRKATGLTQGFDQLRETLKKNIAAIRAVSGSGFGVKFGGIDHFQTLEAGQGQMLAVLDEIERQANVGIGYAFSIEHLINDNLIDSKLRNI
jgi:S1-C subfamily serine protease